MKFPMETINKIVRALDKLLNKYRGERLPVHTGESRKKI